MNNIELEEGMNVLSCPKWGRMHIWVRQGSVADLTIYNAKKKSCRTIMAQGKTSPVNGHINLIIETGSDEE